MEIKVKVNKTSIIITGVNVEFEYEVNGNTYTENGTLEFDEFIKLIDFQ